MYEKILVAQEIFPTYSATASIGPGVDGKRIQLRLGSSPYEMLGLVYDATYGKWVSQEFLASVPSTTSESTTSTSYVNLGSTARLLMPHLLTLWNAGLRPQATVLGYLSNSGANTTSVQLGISTQSDGDASGSTEVLFPDPCISNNVAAGKWKYSDWVAVLSGTPTKEHGLLIVTMKTSAGTATATQVAIGYRWVL